MTIHSLVSIIIPTKNRVALLRETIASIEAQTHTLWEAIVVDDGSDDGTEEMIRDIVSMEKRVRFARRVQQPSGPSACRNVGLAIAKGDFVLFLDSDDLLAPFCIQDRLLALQLDPSLAFVVGQGERFQLVPGDIGTTWGNGEAKYDLRRSLCMHFPWQTASPLWRTSVFEKIGNWNESLHIGEDPEISIRALAHGLPYRRLHKTDVYYRESPGSAGKGNEALTSQACHLLRINQTHKLLSEKGLLTKMNQKFIAGNYLWIAMNYSKANHLSDAFRVWRHAKECRITPILYHLVGIILLIAAGKPFLLRTIAPIAVFVLPRGYLIHPECAEMSERFISSNGEYRPIHYPDGVGDCLRDGVFEYSLWFKCYWSSCWRGLRSMFSNNRR